MVHGLVETVLETATGLDETHHGPERTAGPDVGTTVPECRAEPVPRPMGGPKINQVVDYAPRDRVGCL